MKKHAPCKGIFFETTEEIRLTFFENYKTKQYHCYSCRIDEYSLKLPCGKTSYN